MKKSKKILIGVVLAISLLFIVPFLIPAETFLRKAELIATEALGEPVTITDGNLFLLPSPRVIASNIIVGNNQQITIEKLIIVPTVSTLFSSNKQIDLTITKPVIKKSALAFISALNAKKSQNSNDNTVRISQVNVDELRFIWPEAQLPILNADISLTEANQLAYAHIESTDGKLKAELEPNGDSHLIHLSLDKWTSPVGLPLLIDKGKLEMQLTDNKLNISKMDVALYGGKLSGDAVLNFANKSLSKNKNSGWKMMGHLKVDRLAVQAPSKMVSQSIFLSGDLFGEGSFSANAEDLSDLTDHLQADFKFNVNKGILHGLDLIKVASLLIKQSKGGGDTQFDTFSGLLNTSGKQYHLRNLNISSGLLAATGQVKVKPNKQLDGVVAVEVKSSIGLAAIPLNVSGTLDKPVVLPSKAVLIGAAAGTAILGPGVGTSLGIKAAGALDSVKNLFGGGK